MLQTVVSVCNEFYEILLDSSFFVLLGLVLCGMLKTCMSTEFIVKHLGRGRVLPVLKAAFWGIPLPLCSCGVLPVAVSFKKQGANSGAVTAFLIATPESGIDSIAVSSALLDPLMTIVRPVAAFVTALVAGVCENICSARDRDDSADRRAIISFATADQNVVRRQEGGQGQMTFLPMCSVPAHAGESADNKNVFRRLTDSFISGLRYAFKSVWKDIAGWFFLGIFLAAVITVLVPQSFMEAAFGGGIGSLVLMLIFSIPFYICATASTPVAAALILKGVSPGAALVFLLAGPATNIASFTVLGRVLGVHSLIRYVIIIAVSAVLFGILVNFLYSALALTPTALMGIAGGLLPVWMQHISAGILIVMTLFILKPACCCNKK